MQKTTSLIHARVLTHPLKKYWSIRIAADLLSLFSKSSAKSFTNKLLSAGMVDSAVLF